MAVLTVYPRHPSTSKPISIKRYRFLREIIPLTVKPYCRFTMSLRDVEDLLAERGIDVSYETVRCRANRFGQARAIYIRRLRRGPGRVWQIDGMIVRSRARHAVSEFA